MKPISDHRLFRYSQRFFKMWREQGARQAIARALRVIKRDGLGELNHARGQPNSPDLGHALGPGWHYLLHRDVFFADPPNRPGNHPRIVILGPMHVPQCRLYRAAALQDLLPQATVDIVDSRDIQRAHQALQTASHVIFCRQLLDETAAPLFYEAWRLGLPIAYDVDDPLFSLPEIGSNTGLLDLGAAEMAGQMRAAPGAALMMAACDLVITSTPAMAERVKRFCRTEVIVRPNVIPIAAQAIPPRARKDGQPLTLALASGSQGRDPDIAVMIDGLRAFLTTAPQTRILTLGPCGLAGRLPGFAVTALPKMAYADYLNHLADADIVLLPLAETSFNACKSAVRALDAWSQSRPVIASPVGEIADLMPRAQGGYLAQTPQDWHAGLMTLANPDRADRMGRNGARFVAEHRSATSAEAMPAALADWFAR